MIVSSMHALRRSVEQTFVLPRGPLSQHATVTIPNFHFPLLNFPAPPPLHATFTFSLQFKDCRQPIGAVH
jgi:hypothetical protein